MMFNEVGFLERPDGYQGLAAAYGLRFAAPPRIMDLVHLNVRRDL